MKKWLITGALLLLGGCIIGTKSGSGNPARGSFVCSSTTNCNAEWSRALAWVVQNSYFRIQIQTDNLIQTYGPINADLNPAFEINRTSNSDGSGTITFLSGCGNEFGCNPDPADLMNEFSLYITSN